MKRLGILVEGIAEETFVHLVLAPHLFVHNIVAFPMKLRNDKNPRDVGGGIRSYAQTKKFIENSLKHDSGASFTTMFDLYRLPSSFPGCDQHMWSLDDPYQKAAIVEAAFFRDIGDARFIPYIQLHEFEALLLSDPLKLAIEFPEHQREIARLAEECGRFESPEHINHLPNTAPARRIEDAIPGYYKTAGPPLAAEIGIQTLRQKCKHFDEWIARLEQVGQE